MDGEKLKQYDFKIQHRLGRHHSNADALSGRMQALQAKQEREGTVDVREVTIERRGMDQVRMTGRVTKKPTILVLYLNRKKTTDHYMDGRKGPWKHILKDSNTTACLHGNTQV